jgi:hypothetical protein
MTLETCFHNMAEIPQKDQLALHEYGQQLRAAYAKAHPITDENLDAVKAAVRDQYELEQKQQSASPEIQPAPEKERGIEPPEQER